MLFILSLFINMAAAASMRFLVLTMIVRIIQVSVMWILMQTYLTSKCKNFLRRKVAKVSLTTVKATTTQPQVMNPRVSISDVYTSRMGSMDCADQLCSFYLLRVAIRYRYIFGSSLMYLFVMLLFVNQNALDQSAKHLISNLTSHTNDRWCIAMKVKA